MKGASDKTDETTVEPAGWRRMRFRRNKVWLALGPEGEPIVHEGKVLIKYQRDQDYQYWVHRDGVQPLEGNSAKNPEPAASMGGGGPKPGPTVRGETGDPLMMFTDGASSGNPGPAGIGVLLQYRQHVKEISKYIGRATNNVAELKAILAGLRAVKNKNLPVRVFTDSNYAYGLLVLGWKPRANLALVNSIRKEMARFADLEIHKIKGHAGLAGNERADRLATAAVRAGSGRG